MAQIKPFSLNMHSHSRRANLVTYPNLYFHSATSQYTSKDAKPVPPRFFPVFKDHIHYSLSSPSLASTCTPNFPSWYPPNQPSVKWNNEEITVIPLDQPYSISISHRHLQFLPSSPLSKLLGQKWQTEGKVSVGIPNIIMRWKLIQLLIFTLHLLSPVVMVQTDQRPFFFPKDVAKCSNWNLSCALAGCSHAL